MKVKKLGANMTELQYSDGLRVLVSYETPVAAYWAMLDGDGGPWIKSAQFHSRTTSKHVSSWLPEGIKPRVWPQEKITAFVEAR